MSLNIDYFRNVQGLNGYDHMNEALLDEQKFDIYQIMLDSPDCRFHAKRNGLPQKFVVTRAEDQYKKTIVAFPGEELYIGDEIEFDDEHWLVVDMKQGNPRQRVGTVWLCNRLFRFQNKTSRIIERWGVYVSGNAIISGTTVKQDSQLLYPDKRFRIYLPLDEDTKYIYIDKRLVKDYTYDTDLNKILEVVEVTGRDTTSKSYGKGAHLLMLDVRSGFYSPERDNLEEMICDYIADDGTNNDAEIYIKGRNTMRIGTSQKYDFVSSAEDYIPVFSLDVPSDVIQFSVSENIVTITCPKDKSLIGETIKLIASDESGRYKDYYYEIEVVF